MGLRGLDAAVGQILYARYVSIHVGFVDTENVLLYNVGPSAFCAASRFGVSFAREFACPPEAPDVTATWRHYHKYSLEPHAVSSSSPSPIIRFNFSLPRLNMSLKPHNYWWAAKSGLSQVQSSSAHDGKYAMSLVIQGPSYQSNLAAIVQPLFDGAISALHFDPMILPEDLVCKLLAYKLQLAPAAVADALRNSSHAIFGPRKVVSTYRQFVKWNPADELCVQWQLLIEKCNFPNWQVEVAVLPVA
jgi:hypothetical protein